VEAIDLYILRKTSLPLAAAVGIALLAMLLDKLIHLVVNKGGPFSLLLRMLADLVPPYLGLALPLGIGSSRRRRSAQVVVGTVLLVIYNHTLQFGGTLVASGQLPAFVALWLPFLLFGGFNARSFRMVCRWPSESPLERFIVCVGGAASGAVALARGRARGRSVGRRRLT
jgi:lipopolysaccharide export LptBFGC system permease protein LptF